MAYIICHLPHDLARDLMKDNLQVCLTAGLTHSFEMIDALGQILGHGDVGEDLQVLGGQEAQACFALDAP